MSRRNRGLKNVPGRDFSRVIRLVTRRSPLAMWQANKVVSLLKEHHPHLSFDMVAITTEGDENLDQPLMHIGGKGLFVKALEEALLEKKADLAVHCVKDIPAVLPEGLTLPIILKRGNPFDVFVSNRFHSLSALPLGARVGTSSLRRQSQLLSLRPDLKAVSLRGNVHTRLKKLEQGDYDAIVLAKAGLERLGLEHTIKQTFLLREMVPAPGQGALAIQTRSEDKSLNKLLQVIHDKPTAYCVAAEREMNKQLGGNCYAPIGAYARFELGMLRLTGFVAMPQGERSVLITKVMKIKKATCALKLGEAVGQALWAQGAKEMLKYAPTSK